MHSIPISTSKNLLALREIQAASQAITTPETTQPHEITLVKGFTIILPTVVDECDPKRSAEGHEENLKERGDVVRERAVELKRGGDESATLQGAEPEEVNEKEDGDGDVEAGGDDEVVGDAHGHEVGVRAGGGGVFGENHGDVRAKTESSESRKDSVEFYLR